MNSRLTRCRHLGRVGPVGSCRLVDAAELGADEPDPDARRDQRQPISPKIDPELTPVEICFEHQRNTEPDHDEQGRRIDAGADPGPHPAERPRVSPSPRRSNTIPSVVRVTSPPTQITAAITCTAR